MFYFYYTYIVIHGSAPKLRKVRKIRLTKNWKKICLALHRQNNSTIWYLSWLPLDSISWYHQGAYPSVDCFLISIKIPLSSCFDAVEATLASLEPYSLAKNVNRGPEIDRIDSCRVSKWLNRSFELGTSSMLAIKTDIILNRSTYKHSEGCECNYCLFRAWDTHQSGLNIAPLDPRL